MFTSHQVSSVSLYVFFCFFFAIPSRVVSVCLVMYFLYYVLLEFSGFQQLRVYRKEVQTQ